MEVGHAAVTAAAAQMLPQCNRGVVLAKALDEIRRVEHALVLAAAANGDERHSGVHELAERSAEPSLTRLAIAGAHIAIAWSRATSAGLSGRGNRL